MGLFNSVAVTKAWDGLESSMEEDVIRQLKGKDFYMYRDEGLVKVEPLKIASQVRIPEVKRISDVVVVVTKGKIVNIELKIRDLAGVIKQATDHLHWADYSYICIPSWVFIPRRMYLELVKKGIGVLYWEPETKLDEILPGSFNRSKHINVRKAVKNRIL